MAKSRAKGRSLQTKSEQLGSTRASQFKVTNRKLSPRLPLVVAFEAELKLKSRNIIKSYWIKCLIQMCLFLYKVIFYRWSLRFNARKNQSLVLFWTGKNKSAVTKNILEQSFRRKNFWTDLIPLISMDGNKMFLFAVFPFIDYRKWLVRKWDPCLTTAELL